LLLFHYPYRKWWILQSGHVDCDGRSRPARHLLQRQVEERTRSCRPQARSLLVQVPSKQKSHGPGFDFTPHSNTRLSQVLPISIEYHRNKKRHQHSASIETNFFLSGKTSKLKFSYKFSPCRDKKYTIHRRFASRFRFIRTLSKQVRK